MPRPFCFGVTSESAQSRAEWVDRARKVEDLGYATLLAIIPRWVWDLWSRLALLRQ